MYFSEDTLTRKTNETIEKRLKFSKIEENGIKNNIQGFGLNFTTTKWEEAIVIINIVNNEFRRKGKLHYENFKKSEEAAHLFKVICTNVTSIPMYNIIQTLRILIKWNIPQDTVLIQTLLQRIRASVNDLSVAKIMVVYYILHNLNKCPLTNSLFIALPHVFNNQAQIELNSESVNLMKALKFSTFIGDIQTGRYILSILNKNIRILRIENVIDIISALDLDWVILKPYFITFLAAIQMSKQTMAFYDEGLINVLVSAVSKSDVTFHVRITVLKYLNKMYYSNTPFLNDLIQACCNDTNYMRNCTLEDIYYITKAFVIADYELGENMQTILKEHIINLDCSTKSIIPVTFHLLSLNCYCPEFLERIFTFYNKMSIIDNETIQNILKLHWCIKLLYPSYNKVMLDENKLNKIENKKIHEKDNISLMERLKEACEGDKYVKSGLQTKWGQFVDCVVVIQPNGFLMDISNYDNITFIEELASLPECNKILFFIFPKRAYSVNVKNMLSTVKVQLKAIEQLPGYYPFVINPYLWENLSNKEKVLHLQQAIEQKCNNISNI
ncbi:PREDICTED: uncharacterized protein LOC108572828 [Habropoda laboriosa]|uniref:uncharacterized protein LOC108572828 n=1 Tax=Habropoda laboriosa TaxID=597456 RepID=UPI00083E563F|nr:PREDICTED: uncharacterized protein LOC108572828 [Habropoda laboriosa]